MQPIDFIEHPEGGRYREVFKSQRVITNRDGKQRSALTHIYFELKPGEVSRFHRVASDEIWNLYQGAGLRLYSWDGSHATPKCTILSTGENCFCHIIPAGFWQAAEPISDTVLMGCSVAPGFEFADFTLIDDDTDAAELLKRIAPDLDRFF